MLWSPGARAPKVKDGLPVQAKEEGGRDRPARALGHDEEPKPACEHLFENVLEETPGLHGHAQASAGEAVKAVEVGQVLAGAAEHGLDALLPRAVDPVADATSVEAIEDCFGVALEVDDVPGADYLRRGAWCIQLVPYLEHGRIDAFAPV